MSFPTDTVDPTDRDDPEEVVADEQAVAGDPVEGKRIALVGRFGGMNQRQAANVLRSFQAVVVDQDAEAIDWVVVGAEESPIAEPDLLSARVRDAAAQGKLEIVHETELWQRLGLVEVEQSIRRYYTPAMLAHLLGVSVHVIRRWQRRGLITPVRTLHRLPYFDFQEVATARRLAQWIASGASPKAIEQRLVEWIEVVPDLQRPLDQLSILVEGKQVLLRHGEGLLEPSGQLRFDFDALESDRTQSDLAQSDRGATDRGSPILSIFQEPPDVVPFQIPGELQHDELLEAAFTAEDEGELQLAIDYCHAILARDGPRAEIDFQLGELLYRCGETIAARERYYAAIETDPEFVEARVSLGCVLQETGQGELAVAAFRGALSLHDDYPEAHYHLARLLDEIGRADEAREHWRRFLQLAPESPWAEEAMQQIETADES
ncbi:MAG: MerR family transcriptional regulator [Planctomycetes bacterium]|nr:MerR family transcriptional regulator [Planctomycetota bacterium]